MARGTIPVGLFYASDPTDCTYKVNSRRTDHEAQGEQGERGPQAEEPREPSPPSGTITQLTDDTDDRYPSWSPDGQRIAFDSFRDGEGYWAVYVMDADGKNQTLLTDHTVDAWAPSWSPDGQRIAFNSSRDGDAKIYVIYLD